jgi:hypothetical protein
LMFLVSSPIHTSFFRRVPIRLHAACVQVMFFQGSSVVTAELWPKQIFLLGSFSASMTLHFGMSQCANGLTVIQNLALVLYALILLAPQLMRLISGQMGFRIHLTIVLVSLVVLNLGLARNLSWYRRKS